MGRAAEKVVMLEPEVALRWRIVGRSGGGSWAEAVLDHAALPFIPGGESVQLMVVVVWLRIGLTPKA